jgi:uncharacterized membrane protein
MNFSISVGPICMPTFWSYPVRWKPTNAKLIWSTKTSLRLWESSPKTHAGFGHFWNHIRIEQSIMLFFVVNIQIPLTLFITIVFVQILWVMMTSLWTRDAMNKHANGQSHCDNDHRHKKRNSPLLDHHYRSSAGKWYSIFQMLQVHCCWDHIIAWRWFTSF